VYHETTFVVLNERRNYEYDRVHFVTYGYFTKIHAKDANAWFRRFHKVYHAPVALTNGCHFLIFIIML
tara:strand:- start:5188 stop:5391 length:204 start_codon:yes stop_codon:yes gene_type:complete